MRCYETVCSYFPSHNEIYISYEEKAAFCKSGQRKGVIALMVLFVDRHLYMLHIFVCICIYTYTYISKKPRKYCKSNCNLRSLPIISPGLTVTEKEIKM